MTNFLRYITITLSFITIWAIMLLVWEIHQTSDAGNRYQIVNSDNCVILLDKRTGLTWRNVWNNNKDKIPTNWSPMTYEGNDLSVPSGERELRKQYKTNFWSQFEEVDEK